MSNICKYTVVGLLLLVAGCSQDAKPEGQPVIVEPESPPVPSTSENATEDVAQQPENKVEEPKVDLKVAKFNEALTTFIEDARAVVRGIPITSDPRVYDRRIRELEDSYTRIPEPPAGHPEMTAQWKSARQITVNLGAASTFLGLMADFVRLGAKDKAEESHEHYLLLGKEEQAHLDELEKANQDGRIPKIELSEVIKKS